MRIKAGFHYQINSCLPTTSGVYPISTSLTMSTGYQASKTAASRSYYAPSAGTYHTAPEKSYTGSMSMQNEFVESPAFWEGFRHASQVYALKVLEHGACYERRTRPRTTPSRYWNRSPAWNHRPVYYGPYPYASHVARSSTIYAGFFEEHVNYQPISLHFNFYFV